MRDGVAGGWGRREGLAVGEGNIITAFVGMRVVLEKFVVVDGGWHGTECNYRIWIDTESERRVCFVTVIDND